MLAQHVEESLALLEQVATVVDDGEPALTAFDRMHSVKLRKGAEKITPVLSTLATRFGVSLASHPVGAMSEKLQMVQTLAPLLQRSQELLKQIEDVSLRAQASTSETMAVYYQTLRHLSRKNGGIATSLAPVEEFFAYRHPSTRAHRKSTSKKSKKAAVPTVVVGTAPATTTAVASSGTEPVAPKAPEPAAVPAAAPAVANAHA